MKNVALVFNCHYNGLGVIHGLSECDNLKIYALDTSRSVGTYSKYVKYKKVPNPQNNESGFISFLMNDIWIEEKQKAMLFPTNDQWVEAVSKNKQRLEEKYICCVSEYRIVKQILDKYHFTEEVGSLGVPVPRVYPDGIDLKGLEYPIAIKSIQRRHSGNNEAEIERSLVADELRFCICDTLSDAEKYRDFAHKNGVEIYFQKIVHGDSSCMRTIGLFAKNGIIKGLFYGKKVRGYPAKFGDCTVGEVCEIPTWAKDYAKRIIDYTKYTGIAEIEFMIDECTGKPFFIEMNPRSWSWIGICKYAGVNLAKIAYENLALEIDTEYKESKNDDKPLRFYKVIQDYRNCMSIYKRDCFYAWGSMNKKEWKTEKARYKCVYAEFPKNDLPVWVYNIIELGKSFVRDIIRRLTMGGGDKSIV